MRFPKLRNFLMAFLMSSALFITFETPEPYESYIINKFIEAVFKIFEWINGVYEGYGFVISVLTVAFTYILNQLTKVDDGKSILEGDSREKVLAAFLSFMYVGGKAFAYNNSLSSIWIPRFNLLKALVIFLGFYYLYRLGISVFFYILENRKKFRFNIWTFLPAWIKRAYDKKPFLTLWCVIFGSWIIHLICRYPAAMSYDNWRQLHYFFGVEGYTKAQPIFHTWLTGTFVDTSIKLFGSANIGIFVYVTIQAMFMAAALAWTLCFMKKWSTPGWFKLLVLFIYCVTPVFTGNAAWAIKDYPHMIGFVVWFVCIVDIVIRKKDSFSFKTDWKLIVLWTISAASMALFRKNGLYIYFVTVAVLIFVLLRHAFKNKQKLPITAILTAILPVVLFFAIEAVIVAKYNVVNDNIKEMLSLPVQQTVRYYHFYSDEITPEEKEAISKVFDYDSLWDDFFPETADNAKADYIEGSFSDLMGYFRVWFLMFFKHPLCYIEATWNQNYYIFMPDFDNPVYNESCNYGNGVCTEEFLEFINMYVPDKIQGLPIGISSMYRMLNRFPIINMLNNLAFYMAVFLSISLFMRRKKLSYYKLTFIPVWMCFVFIILAPMIWHQPRYSWGIIYTMPMIVAMYMHLLDMNKE